jgi:hypothetical protein
MSEKKQHEPRLQESIEAIQALAGEVTQTVADLPEHVVRWKPAENIWSIAEILGHVEEAAPYWTGEIQRVVANPGVQWGRNHHDEARLAAVAATSQRSTGEVIAGFHEAAKTVVSALGSLRETDLQIESPSRNPRWGVKPMSFVLNQLVVSHLRGHRDQILRNLSQFSAQAGEVNRQG